MQKLIISEVLDNSTGKRSERFGYRVGRECCTAKPYIEEGVPLIVNYFNNRGFMTTPVLDVEEDDYGFWVKTKNRNYRFDYIYEKAENEESKLDNIEISCYGYRWWLNDNWL